MITLADMMAHLCVQIGSPLSGLLEQKVRTSVLDGWNRLFSLNVNWRWYTRTGYLQLSVAQTEGSAEFNRATLQVTLTDATFPANAESMHIRLGNSWYPVYRRLDDTTVELRSPAHPAADIDAGAAYVLQQTVYPLPVEVGGVLQVIRPDQSVQLIQYDPVAVLDMSETFGTLSRGAAYALVSYGKYPDRWCLWVPHVIEEDHVLKYLYRQRRPAIVVFREDAGSVTVADGVATFSDAVVRRHWEGCVLRVSRNDQTPTGNHGDIPASDVEYNVDMDEMTITEYLTASTCRVSDQACELADAPFTVSSHIDVKPGAMETLVQRLVEDAYGVRPVGTHMEGITSARRVREAASEAMVEDASGFRSNDPAVMVWYRRLSDIARIPL